MAARSDSYVDMSQTLPSHVGIYEQPESPYENPTKRGTDDRSSHIYIRLKFWENVGHSGHVSKRALIGIIVALAVVINALIVLAVVLTSNNKGKKAIHHFIISVFIMLSDSSVVRSV